MPDTKERNQEEKAAPKTPQEVMDEISYIIYPEKELDEREAEGEGTEQQGGAYGYLKEQYGDRSDWCQFERLYREQLEIANASYSYVGEEMLREKQRLLDLRLELEGVKGKIDLQGIPEVREATRQEERRFLERQNAGAAAIFAFDKYADSCLAGMDTDAVRKSAAAVQGKKEQDARNEAQAARLLEEAAKNSLEYVVRGAPILCNCGTHSRHLDMLSSHGFYVNGKAVAFEGDRKPEENIPYFGHCQSPCHNLSETISLKMQKNVNAEGVSLTEYDGAVYEGVKCIPEFHSNWKNTHEETLIAKDGKKGTDEAVYERAVTTASFLVCRQGGIVYPLTSGQHDESYYQAPFLGYPFEDVGSEVFMKWCENNHICPYMPGTADFYDWNRKEINRIKQEGQELQRQSDKWLADAEAGRAAANSYAVNYAGANPYQPLITANRRKLKEMYGTFLDQAYTKGLDTMPDEEEDKIRAAVEEYIDSGLLTEEEKAEAADRYAGLRLKYGDNGRRQAQGYTWQDQALYDETLEKLRELKEKAEEIRKMPDTSYNGYAGRSQANTVSKEADEPYHVFMAEITSYGPGYKGLSAEQKAAAESIYYTYNSMKENRDYPSLMEAMENLEEIRREAGGGQGG